MNNTSRRIRFNQTRPIVINLKKVVLLIALPVIIAGGFLVGCRDSVPSAIITPTFPASDEPISAFGWVGITFAQPVKASSVEAAFSLTPPVVGVTFWRGETFWFRPLQAFDSDIRYQARISGDLETETGTTFPFEISWEFSIRDPELIYYLPTDEWGEIWHLDLESGTTQQISQTGANVLEFIADRSGAWITYTAQNELAGADLWLMDRIGDTPRLLVSCGQDRCAEPAWSPDNQIIAYTRERFQPDGGYQPGQIWTVQVDTGETAQLYQSEAAFGHSPSFSPDGARLATYDAIRQGIRILELATSEEAIIPRVLPGSGAWLWDGSKIIFTDVVPAENEPGVVIYVVDVVNQELTPLFGADELTTDFSQPLWSPDGSWLAVSLRPVNAEGNKTLWLLKVDGSESILIADEPSATFSSYQWHPEGDRLVYQRFKFDQGWTPSLWLWDWNTLTSQLLVDGGARPQWLP